MLFFLDWTSLLMESFFCWVIIPVESKEGKKDLKIDIMKAADPNVLKVKYLLN